MLTQNELKFEAAKKALEFIESGMVVGLGSGSTATIFIKLLGEKVRDGLQIRGIASSNDSAQLGAEVGIPIIDFHQSTEIDVAVDGADEVAPGLALIKGGGGKLLREKIVASAAKRFIVVADTSKLVHKLGRFPLPIEVIPMAEPLISNKLRQMGLSSKIRPSANPNEAYVTDEGNLILDCSPTVIEDPTSLAAAISEIPGVVEHGLFLSIASLAIVAGETDIRTYTPTSPIP